MTSCKKSGARVFHCPRCNRGVAFDAEERAQLGLNGLLPPAVNSVQEQVERYRSMLSRFERPLDKALMLDSLHYTDQDLYFRLLIDHTDEYMPIVYTPTVGEFCQNFSRIFRYPRGLFVSIEDAGHVGELIDHCPQESVDVIVVTDGERILGLGDQGLNGMGIPIGKLSLYTACAGIHPSRTLPVVIDVGTNNEEYLADPLYLGLRRRRETGPAYDALIDEFITEARRRWPKVLIQFEDFGNRNAFRLLERYRNQVLCFNDDIQGTAAVTLAGVYSAMRVLHANLLEQKFLFFGAGEAATGIANLIADAMVEAGMPREEALKHCVLFDSKGLVTKNREHLAAHKLPFAHDLPEADNFLTAVRLVKPTGIIGVAAQAKAFSSEVLAEMASLNERPIIFALSNPTSKAECTAEEAYRGTNGRALFASGSPFAPVQFGGRTFVPRQGNNSYVFPALGLGAVFAGATRMPNAMFLAAARRLSELVSEEDLAQGSLYPPLADIRRVSAVIGAAVAECAYAHGLATNPRPDDLEAAVAASMYEPRG